MPRRVLMLCYYYPPVQTSGTARSVGFTTWLRDYGWEPVVLTVKRARDRWVTSMGEPPGSVEVHRTYEWDLTGLLNLLQGSTNWLCRKFGGELDRPYFREAFGVPDQQIAWLSTLKGVGLARKCDVVYASCTPFSSALSAVVIGRIARKPVVLDFRDPWVHDFGITGATPLGIYKRTSDRLEAFAVGRCDHLILNTDGALCLYAERYRQFKDKFSVIPNGYDQLTPASGPRGSSFKIVHAGTFYGGRHPWALIQALEAINDERIEFIHVGERYLPLESYAGPAKVTQVGVVSRAEVLRIMLTASALYLRQAAWNNIAVAAKTYEYLATGLPIICHGPEGDNSRIVRQYASDSLLVTDERNDEIVRWIRERLDMVAPPPPRIDDEFRSRFDRRNLTAALAAVFDGVAASPLLA